MPVSSDGQWQVSSRASNTRVRFVSEHEHLGMRAWNDGDGDSEASAILDELHKAVHIVEELRDDDLSARLNLQRAHLVMP